MEEIESNNFNPKISRYIRRATADEEIDLSTVHIKLTGLEDEIALARKQRKPFLKELDLPSLS